MSEFGTGLTYCLANFIAHEGRDNTWEPSLWFIAASDHFYEMNVPDSMPTEIKVRAHTLRDKALHFGHGFGEPRATRKDKVDALAEARAILMLIDKHIGAEVEKGEWE